MAVPQCPSGLLNSRVLLSRFYERTGTSENIGSGALGRGFARPRAGTVEASSVRGFGFRESGSSSRPAAGLCRSHLWQGQNAGSGGGNRAFDAAAQGRAAKYSGYASGRHNFCGGAAGQFWKNIQEEGRRSVRNTTVARIPPIVWRD